MDFSNWVSVSFCISLMKIFQNHMMHFLLLSENYFETFEDDWKNIIEEKLLSSAEQGLSLFLSLFGCPYLDIVAEINVLIIFFESLIV